MDDGSRASICLWNKNLTRRISITFTVIAERLQKFWPNHLAIHALFYMLAGSDSQSAEYILFYVTIKMHRY